MTAAKAIDADEVRVAGAGHVYAAPKGTALPVDLDPTDALPVAWIDLGYVTEDGVTFTFGRNTTDLNAWQGTKVRVLTTDEPKTVAMSIMQTSAETLKVAFGGGTLQTTTGTHVYTPPDKGSNEERVLCVEFTDGTYTYRYFLYRVQIEGEVAFTLAGTDAVAYPLTFGVLDNDPPYIIVSNDPAMATA